MATRSTSTRMSATGTPGRRTRRALTTMISGMAAACVIFSTTAGPAAAAVLPALAERETWSLDEREAHGEDLWGKDAVEGAEPVTVHEQETTPVEAPPEIVKGAPSGEDGTDTDDDAGVPLASLAPGAVTLEPGVGNPVQGKAGDLPVTVKRPTASGKGARTADEASAPVRVRALGAAAVERVGFTGALLTVTNDASGQADAKTASVVDVAVDVSGLDVSPDWASRARLVQLPACALTTPDVKGCRDQRDCCTDR